MSQVNFLGISRTTALPLYFWGAIFQWSYFCWKPLLQKSEIKTLDQRRFHKKLNEKVNEKKLKVNALIANIKPVFEIKLLANLNFQNFLISRSLLKLKVNNNIL